MKKYFKTLVIISLFILIINNSSIKAEAKETAFEMVEKMSMGWSLGNTFECVDGKNIFYGSYNVNNSLKYETLWGNPTTTKQMIDTVAKAGFNVLRIPVTYTNHIDETGLIDEKWLARIDEVVNYGLANDMYVIINLHHDTGYGNKLLQANLESIELEKAKAGALWIQIAKYFNKYDSRLIFEGYNELLDMSAQNPWYGNKNSWEAMNIMNQYFVDVVRATGGNNATRNLLVNTYGAQTTYGPLESFVVPKDKEAGHIIVGIHTYESNEKSLTSIMDSVNKKFTKKGYPVILGEFGVDYRKENVKRVALAQSITNVLKSANIKAIWWDDGGNFRLLNRYTCTWYDEELVKLLCR